MVVRLSIVPLSTVLALLLLATPLGAEVQQAGKVVRIGFLHSQSRTPPVEPVLTAFRNGLRDLGWVEGHNLLIEWRWAEGRTERLPALAAELVRLNVDVLVTSAAPPALAAKRATTTIPIVSVYTLDPVVLGLVASLARPGGNITGLSAMSLEYTAKLLEMLKEVLPRASRVAVLGDPVNPSYAIYWRELDVAARRLGLTLQSAEVRRLEDFDTAFSAMTKSAPDALLVMHQPLFFVHQKRIVDLVAKSRLPAVYGSREYAEIGGLMAYGANLPEIFRRTATYVDKILRGAKPADLPVEQPSKFELVINVKTAKALGVTIPPSLLLRADQVQ